MAKATTTQILTTIKEWVLGKLADVWALIPSQASSSNQLADKAFVNSSIATATATFRGTYNLVSDLSLTTAATQQQIAAALATKMAALSITPDNNDYAFVLIPTADATPTEIAKIEKYKYNGTAWAFEYELNNSGFTADQWAAINSGATMELIGKLSDLPTNAELTAILTNLVAESGVYDVTANNRGATFASLEALLNDANLSTLIPTAVRKGGMSIKFIQGSAQSSDNKYVQYRLMTDAWSVDIDDWAIADEGVYVENPEFVYVKTDAEGKILFGIKVDGEPFYGVGCPEQVKEYVEKKITELSLDELIAGIQVQLATKVDKEEGKSLIISEFANAQKIDTIHEYMFVFVDENRNIVGAVKKDGTIYAPGGLEALSIIKTQGAEYYSVSNPEWFRAFTDENGKIIIGIDKDGKIHAQIYGAEDLDKHFAKQNILTGKQILTGINSIYHYGMGGVSNRSVVNSIPSQSIWDIRFAKKAGYKCLEANLHKTADGKYVVTHGLNGALGHDFNDLFGQDASGVVIRNNSLQNLRENYVYYTDISDYRVPITTLEEFCAEAKKEDIGVMLQYVDIESLNIARELLGNNLYIAYNAPRGVYDGVILEWLSYQDKNDIINRAKFVGAPYVYSMSNPDYFTTAQLSEICKALHNMGCCVASAYQTEERMSELREIGFDFFAVGGMAKVLNENQYVFEGKVITFNIDGTISWEQM